MAASISFGFMMCPKSYLKEATGSIFEMRRKREDLEALIGNLLVLPSPHLSFLCRNLQEGLDRHLSLQRDV